MDTLYFAACALAIASYWFFSERIFGRTIASLLFAVFAMSIFGAASDAARVISFYCTAIVCMCAVAYCMGARVAAALLAPPFLFAMVTVSVWFVAPRIFGAALFAYWAWIAFASWNLFATYSRARRVCRLRRTTAVVFASSLVADLVCIGWWMRTGSYVEEQIVSTFFLAVLATLPILWTARTRIA